MSQQKTSAKSQFESWSRWYDRSVLQRIFFAPTHRHMLECVKTWPANARVLDIGCGTGIFAKLVLETLPESSVVGIDLSPGMVDKAMIRCESFGSRARFTQGDSEHLPFIAGSFDVVCCAHSFHHYPNQREVVSEFARVLRPGGKLILADADRDCFWGWALFDGFVNLMEGGVKHCSRKRFRELLAEAGFGDIQQSRHGLLMPFVINRATRSNVVRRAA